MRNPAAAAKLLAELRGAEPLTAVRELTAWLDAAKSISGHDEKIRCEILSLIQEASDPPLSVLVAQYCARPSDKQTERDAAWHPLNSYLRALTGALCSSAGHLLKEAATDPSLQLPGAAGAARGLHTCRLLVKACLVRYQSIPPNLWRMAYTVHRLAEAADCAGIPIRMHAAQKTTTTATQELLRLLMLQSSSPEMMTPAQIEVADWVIELVGGDFTLRPPGVADNPFCFDPAGEGPPRRAASQPPLPDAGTRYFGAGMGYDALDRIYKQLATTRGTESKAFGKDIALHSQLSAVSHLLAFWAEACPYSRPARAPAEGKVRVIHGFAPAWQHLSHVRSGITELTLAEDGDVPAQAPETWALQDTAGNELGAEIPHGSGDSVRCGDVVAVSTGNSNEWWLGLVRSLHAEPGHGTQANIFIVSRNPQSMQMRPVIAKGEENAYTEKSARQFAFNSVRAIILSDGAATSQPANLLLSPDFWKEGRVFDATKDGVARYIRVIRFLRQADDYVRATFEWAQQQD